MSFENFLAYLSFFLKLKAVSFCLSRNSGVVGIAKLLEKVIFVKLKPY